MKKPFRETNLFKFINEKVKPVAGDVLEIVGDITGRESIAKVGEFLNGRREENAQMQALWIQFQEKQMEFELEFQRIEMENFKLEVQDKENARSREIQFMQANGGKRDWLMGVAVCIALLMYVGAFAFLCYGPAIPTDKKDLFNMGLGQVLTFAGMVFSYYLGTSRGSKIKDQTIAKNAFNEPR